MKCAVATAQSGYERKCSARQTFIGIWIRKALEGDTVEVWGGEQRRDLLFADDLIAEGTARDIVRVVQQARRDAGLDVSDRISLTLGLDEETSARVQSYLGYISGETLATNLVIDGTLSRTIATEDVTIGVALDRLL